MVEVIVGYLTWVHNTRPVVAPEITSNAEGDFCKKLVTGVNLIIKQASADCRKSSITGWEENVDGSTSIFFLKTSICFKFLFLFWELSEAITSLNIKF